MNERSKERSTQKDTQEEAFPKTLNLDLLESLSGKIVSFQKGLQGLSIHPRAKSFQKEIDGLSARCGDMLDDVEEYALALPPDESTWDEIARKQIFVRKLNFEVLERHYIELLRRVMES